MDATVTEGHLLDVLIDRVGWLVELISSAIRPFLVLSYCSIVRPDRLDCIKETRQQCSL
eukprot:SAG11_NODE_1213_length_5506_cov_2.953579_7_plen_59_part_00